MFFIFSRQVQLFEMLLCCSVVRQQSQLTCFMCFSCRTRLLYVKYGEPSRTIKRFGVFRRFFFDLLL